MMTIKLSPLLAAHRAAVVAEKTAHYAWARDASDGEDSGTAEALKAAKACVLATRAALVAAEEEVPWDLADDSGYVYQTVWAVDVDEALEACDAGDNGELEETLLTTHTAHSVDLDEEGSIELRIDPPEPRCGSKRDAHEHDWRPDAGGCAENPGVYAHGGGVIVVEVCSHCHLERRTDTFGTNHANGTQGHEIVTYVRPYKETP